MKYVTGLVWCLCLSGLILAGDGTPPPAAAGGPPVRAFRSPGPVKVDGVLAEPGWLVESFSGFIQAEPASGQPATERTEVMVLYDDHAVYVGARLFDSEPDKIRGLLSRRDDFNDSDWFIFSVDPYLDRQSGFQFAVNAAGTLADWAITNDFSRDSTWDGVWEGRAVRNGEGWTVEMRIPFDQLRFKNQPELTWGINFQRHIKRKNEIDGAVWIPRNESGFASRFLTLHGIRQVKASQPLAFTPYTAAKLALTPREEGNPFRDGRDFDANAGLDAQIYLRSNLTLNLTFNPDFGQVEVDPAVMNLSAAETYYQEKRPFFLEQAGTFRFGRGGSNRNISANWAEPTLFYSRRIGRPPRGMVSGDGFVDIPEWTTIIGAAKLTGQLLPGLNIGFLGALTGREFATIDDGESRWRREIEPRTGYSVLRVMKEMDGGRRALGFMGTAAVRDLHDRNLAGQMNTSAYTFGTDGWTFLDREKNWVVTGWLAGSRVTGDPLTIHRLQRSYPHYFQRPDAPHLRLRPDAGSLSGTAGRFSINRQQGNFLFNSALGFISPGFEANDLGYQSASDIINFHIMAGYRWLEPGKYFRSKSFNVFTQRNYDFGGNLVGHQQVIFIANAELSNYWTLYFQLSHNPSRWAKDLCRGGPYMRMPRYTWMDFGVSTDDRKSLVFDFSGYILGSAAGEYSRQAGMTMQWRPRSNVSLSLSPQYGRERSASQWVRQTADPLMTATYGSRYVFAGLDQTTVSCSLRLNWVFTPFLSLQGYLQPYIAAGDYEGFKELARPRSFDFNLYGTGGSVIARQDGGYRVDPDGAGQAPAFSFPDPDFNYKSLRGTVVLRWEYRPGSVFFAVWTQNRADYSNPGDFRLGRDLGNLFRASGDNIFMVKWTYRIKM